ncbi:MAG: hypothetical protein Q9215_006359 [Flavoplaca cf. flavocitrina]
MTGNGDLFYISDVGLALVNFTRLYLEPDEDVYHKLFETLACDHAQPPDHGKRSNSSALDCRSDIQKLFKASECSLYCCVRQCAANVRLGKLEETFLPWSWWNTTVPEFSNARFGGIESYQLMPSRDDWKARYPTQSLIDPTKNNTVNPVSTTIQPGPKFVERSSHENLSEWLCSLFDATFSFENVLAMPPIYHGATEVAYKFRDSTYKMMGSDSGQTTSEDAETDSMSLIFEHLAESVTQAIRQQVLINESDRIGGGRSKNRVDVRPSSMSNDLFENVDYEPNAVATGTVFENRAVVRVHWRGLLFPAALLLLTVIVTISTKIRSLQQGIPDWGSSMMPLMLRGPYSCAVDASMSYAETNAQMDRLAKTTKVSLQRTGSGWNLRTVEETGRA